MDDFHVNFYVHERRHSEISKHKYELISDFWVFRKQTCFLDSMEVAGATFSCYYIKEMLFFLNEINIV